MRRPEYGDRHGGKNSHAFFISTPKQQIINAEFGSQEATKLIQTTMVKLNKTNLFASMMLVSALFLSCSRADNPVDPINDDTVPEQPSDDGTAYLTCPDANHPHMIDLGLPSGTKWACCNVGATAPEEYGGYYAWGETSEKSYYDWDTYQYGYYNYDGDYSHLVNIGSDIAGTGYDAATANWGSPWRVPSVTQIQELLDNATSKWSTENGVAGRRFTGTNGGSVFLPAAGFRWDGELNGAGTYGSYWSSSLDESGPSVACSLYFFPSDAYLYYDSRYEGRSVRPVR